MIPTSAHRQCSKQHELWRTISLRSLTNGTYELLRLRNRAILTVIINSGICAPELLSMNVNDIVKDVKTKTTGKVCKQRVVAIGESEPTVVLMLYITPNQH